MEISWSKFRIEFLQSFTLSKGTRSGTHAVILKIEHEGVCAYGMSALPPYYKEDQESVIESFRKLNLEPFKDPTNVSAIMQYLRAVIRDNRPALAAADIAIHDLACRFQSIALADLTGGKHGSAIPTSFTIGVQSPELIKAEVAKAKDFQFLKLKMGMENEWEILEELVNCSDKKIFVDVNQGWENKETSLKNIERLANHNIEFVEEPFKTINPKDYFWLKERSPLPVFVDEHVWTSLDLKEWGACVDGINIKLMKTGGLQEAMLMIKQAKQMDLQLMLGCMAECSCTVAASHAIAENFDYHDLDGPFLIKNDPFVGLYYENGLVKVKGDKGTGVDLDPEYEIEWIKV